MNYNIRGENMEVTPSLRDYVEKKVGKVERYFDSPPVADVHVKMQVQNTNENDIEVTILCLNFFCELKKRIQICMPPSTLWLRNLSDKYANTKRKSIANSGKVERKTFLK